MAGDTTAIDEPGARAAGELGEDAEAHGEVAAEAPGEPAAGDAEVTGEAAGEAVAEAGQQGGPEPGGQEWAHLDGLGTVQPSPAGGTVKTLAVGLPERAAQRLAEFGSYELLTDVQRLGEAELVVVSTRLPRGDVASLLAEVRDRRRAPLVALVHTGGESLAVEVMRAGGLGVVAEGNEEAIGAYVSGAGHDNALVDTFERQIAQSGGGGNPERDRDPVTGLPGATAFDQRVSEFAKASDVPRLAFLRLLHLGAPGGAQRTVRAASALVRRRLGVQFMPLVRAYGAELYALDDLHYALVGEQLSPHDAEQLGSRLARVASTFAPSGHTALGLAMGHAGSEVSQELATLRELAQRALEVAAVEKGGAVVNADTLSLGVSSTTELEAATRMVAYVEHHDPYPPGHGARVAELASALARGLGYEGAANTRIRLAALLHDIGKVSLPPEALAATAATDGPAGEAWRTHPERGADYLRVSGGVELAEAVRAHHEHWDGSGFPDGLAGNDIPTAARVIAVADAFEGLVHGVDGSGSTTPEEALAALRSLAGVRLDPALVELLADVLAAAARDRGLSLAASGVPV